MQIVSYIVYRTETGIVTNLQQTDRTLNTWVCKRPVSPFPGNTFEDFMHMLKYEKFENILL